MRTAWAWSSAAVFAGMCHRCVRCLPRAQVSHHSQAHLLRVLGAACFRLEVHPVLTKCVCSVPLLMLPAAYAEVAVVAARVLNPAHVAAAREPPNPMTASHTYVRCGPGSWLCTSGGCVWSCGADLLVHAPIPPRPVSLWPCQQAGQRLVACEHNVCGRRCCVTSWVVRVTEDSTQVCGGVPLLMR